jgi:hypothetical protein
VNIVSLIAAIVGMVLGTAGFVMSLLSYLRDRPGIKVSLNLNMIETRTREQYGMVVVTNTGRRPVHISAVVIVPPGVSMDSGTHLVINGSLEGNRLGEGDKPYKCMVDKAAFIGHPSRWREIRAYAEDSTGRRYLSPLPKKTATPPKWAVTAIISAFCMFSTVCGCNSKTVPTITTSDTPASTHTNKYPIRPSVPPPPFKLFHQSPDTLTLVTNDTATSDQIAAIIYQLRDAANSHTFDALHLPQSLIDKRSPILWFHIYRGAKCASEKYTTGKLPCGASYHAAGEFTLGSFKNPNRTDGDIVIDEDHQTQLWNPDAK